MAEPTIASAPTTIAISALTGAIDTVTVMAIGSVMGIGIVMPAALGTFVWCSVIAFVAMSLVQAGARS